MNFIKNIIARIIKWLRPGFKYRYCLEVPDTIEDNTIYIIGNQLEPWLITFYCPCGCHNILDLNLLREAKPCWSYTISTRKKITISPSVSRIVGCKSHFFVRNGKIEWA